ncbi:MAG: hypothetical protein WDN44_12555 [Sphingomonas sp.]
MTRASPSVSNAAIIIATGSADDVGGRLLRGVRGGGRRRLLRERGRRREQRGEHQEQAHGTPFVRAAAGASPSGRSGICVQAHGDAPPARRGATLRQSN